MEKTAGKKLAILGPAGTHSEAAALYFNEVTGNVYTPVLYDEIFDALTATTNGETDAAFVPVENSLEGAINVTLDFLAAADDLTVVRELVWTVRNVLAAKGAAKDIARIYSHTQPISQCRRFLRGNFPEAEIIKVSSTAKAASVVAAEADHSCAAICTKRAAKLHGLGVVAENIEDTVANCTRFFLLTKKDAALPEIAPAAADTDERTLIICRIDGREAGSLLKVLEEFALRGVNLTRIESRPARTKLGEYIFFFDVESNTVAPSKREAAIAAVTARSLWLKNLGTFRVLKDRQ